MNGENMKTWRGHGTKKGRIRGKKEMKRENMKTRTAPRKKKERIEERNVTRKHEDKDQSRKK